MSIHRALLLLAAATALTVLGPVACTGSSSSHRSPAADPTTAQEQHAVDALALKKRYPEVVTGTDVKGKTLTVYVDLDNLYSMDEETENAMRSTTLQSWKRIWSSAHRGEHGTLRLSLRDYYGNEVVSDAAHV